MDKICVEVFVPGINKKYDVVLQPDLKVSIASTYIYKTISEYEALKGDESSAILCSAGQKKILDGEQTLVEAGIRDGSNLIIL